MSFKKTAETLEPGSKTLSRKYYTDPIILDQEYENIFQNNWLPVARAADLDEQGTFKTFEIAGESIIVLKALGFVYNQKAGFPNPSNADTMAGLMI